MVIISGINAAKLVLKSMKKLKLPALKGEASR